MYYLDVVDVVQMSEAQAISPMLSLLRGWELQTVSDFSFRFWLAEKLCSGNVVRTIL